MEKALWIDKFCTVYSELGTDNLDSLSAIYHSEVEFIDPMHRVSGRESLLAYFKQSYLNVISCQFIITDVIAGNDQAAVYWTMTFSHNKLNRQQPISIDGHSRLEEKDGLVIYHRDYFDVGAMVYQHVPVVGTLVNLINNRVGQ